MVRAGLPVRRAPKRNSLLRQVGRALAKLHLIRNLVRTSTVQICVVSFGSDTNLFPGAYVRESIVYCFDCWPEHFRQWEGLFRRHAVRVAFFSARVVKDHFRSRLQQTTCLWLPEATEPALYCPEKPLAARHIDVIEYGRRYQPYHEAILSDPPWRGFIHHFGRAPHRLAFETPREFIAALGDSKVSVCFPCSMTFPGRSAYETATHRYFESMASKCIVVGHCPSELANLFGYNPVVEADMLRVTEQLRQVLLSPERFQALVDKNYARLLEVGTWDKRVQQMLEVLQTLGYCWS